MFYICMYKFVSLAKFVDKGNNLNVTHTWYISSYCKVYPSSVFFVKTVIEVYVSPTNLYPYTFIFLGKMEDKSRYNVWLRNNINYIYIYHTKVKLKGNSIYTYKI